MSTPGSLNTKNPTIKRIHREALELTTHPSPDFTAGPLDTNLFEWHFTLRGPPAPSPYAGGIYHGRIVLPPTYPLRPPSFRFLTPSGRFEVNREICLSISGHHEESWQPAWGIRTALVAIRSFMDTDAKGQLGGIDTNAATRARMARESPAWRCPGCGGRTNDDVMRDLEEECAQREQEGEEHKGEEAVPEELKLGYRDELGKVDAAAEGGGGGEKQDREKETSEMEPEPEPAPEPAANGTATATAPVSAPAPPPLQQAPMATSTQPRPPRPRPGTADSSHWLDMAIAGVVLALFLMLVRKLVHYL